MQFLSSFDLNTKSHYHNPNCRTPAQSFESLYLLARTQSCRDDDDEEEEKEDASIDGSTSAISIFV